jgi:hypothetical protein
MSRSRLATVATAIAFLHFVVYSMTLVWGHAIGLQGEEPFVIKSIFAVLGTPLMHLLWLSPDFLGGRWWGDDSNLIIALAVSNSMLWGVGGTVIWGKLREGRLPKAA